MKAIITLLALVYLTNTTFGQTTEPNTTRAGQNELYIYGALYGSQSIYTYKSYYPDYYGNYNNTWTDAKPGIGIQVGNKWYFGGISTKNVSFGINAIWIRAHFTVTDDIIPEAQFSPLNMGFTNLIKLDENNAIEFNLNFGGTMRIDDFDVDPFNNFSANINPEVVFRMKRFRVGLGYIYTSNVNIGNNSNHDNYYYDYNREQHQLVMNIGISITK